MGLPRLVRKFVIAAAKELATALGTAVGTEVGEAVGKRIGRRIDPEGYENDDGVSSVSKDSTTKA